MSRQLSLYINRMMQVVIMLATGCVVVSSGQFSQIRSNGMIFSETTAIVAETIFKYSYTYSSLLPMSCAILQ